MNKKHLLFPFMVCMLFSMIAFAQPGNTNCGTCAIDTGCPTSMPDGGLCPEIIPDGTVGQPYDFSVTFYMPEMITVTDPITTDVTLIDVQITDLVNLPSGLEWSCSNPDCSYQPSSNPPDSELGCIRICGTPTAAPGVYTINIRLLADVFVSALNATLPDQEQFYTATVTILPPDVPIDYTYLSGCGSLADTLTAQLDANPNQPTTWSWDLGGGQTSDQKGVSYEYTTPGVYDIILETTIYDYVVTGLCINSISGGYCNDVEELLCNCGTPIVGVCPDPYVSILGTNLPTALDVSNHCWNNLSIPTGGLSFSLAAYDEDNGPPFGSDNDLLGDFTININNGASTYSFSNGNMSGSVTIGTVLNSVSTDTLTVTVWENPPAPELSATNDLLSVTNNNGYNVQWYLEGVAIDGATSATYNATVTGNYSAIFTDANGCVSEESAVLYDIQTGVNNTISGANISALYPNPAQNEVYLSINFLDAHDLNINIIDALGRTVYQQNEAAQSGTQTYTMDVSEWKNGLYFVQIRLDDGSQMTQKLMIK